MRISTIISYPLGWLIGANYRCARKSDPVLKLFRAGRGVCKDPFRALGEVCSIFCQCFISHVILGSVHKYSLSSQQPGDGYQLLPACTRSGKCNYIHTMPPELLVTWLRFLISTQRFSSWLEISASVHILEFVNHITIWIWVARFNAFRPFSRY